MKELKRYLDDTDILDSWYEDLWELKEQLNELRRHIRQVEKERKKQPSLVMKSDLNSKVYIVNRYTLIKQDDGRIIMRAESRREATPEEVAWLEKQDRRRKPEEGGV